MEKPELFKENQISLFIHIWNSFCNYLVHNNRFMINKYLFEHESEYINEDDRVNLILLFQAIDFMVENNICYIDKLKVLHRARLYYKEEEKKSINEIDKCFNRIINYYKSEAEKVIDDKDSYNWYKNIIEKMEESKNAADFAESSYRGMRKIEGSMGFDIEDMKAPPKEKAKSGRTNPEGIPYLYTSEDKNTCIAEVKPYIGSQVSVIDLVPKKGLKIFNIDSNEYRDESEKENRFIKFLEDKFSLPYRSDEPLKYLPTQYITEYIRFKGLDGIRHKSSVAEGYNVIIFNQANVEFKNKTELYHIKGINYDKDLIQPNITVK